MNTAQYLDKRGLYNMTKDQVEAASTNTLKSIYCYCNHQGGWTVGTRDLISSEIASRHRALIEAYEMDNQKAWTQAQRRTV